MTMTLILGLLALSPAQAADTAAVVEALQPHTTRAGTLRFVDPVLREAAAPALLAARLVQADEAPAVGDISPDEPVNMNILVAFERAHPAPESFCLNDAA